VHALIVKNGKEHFKTLINDSDGYQREMVTCRLCLNFDLVSVNGGY